MNPERKFYIVTLLLGYSFTTSTGQTFYQNRAARVDLADEEIKRMSGMEGGRKFRIVDAREEDIRSTPGSKPGATPNAGSVIDIGAFTSATPPAGKAEDKAAEKPKREAVLDDDPPEIEDGDEDASEGSDEPKGAASSSDPIIEAMTVAELRGYLTDRKIDFPPAAKKADLVKLAIR
jgi:hypothetical protein